MSTPDSQQDQSPHVLSPALKAGAILFAALVLGSFGGYAYLQFGYPKSNPASVETIDRTPERVERGRYLAEHVLECMGCHSERDFDRFAFPSKPGTRGAAGDCFDESLGFPGNVCPGNLTSDPVYGLGRWSDGEIMRAIREGVGRTGHALFPMMPYREFRTLSDEDTRAVVAYLRTLPPQPRGAPPTRLDFPLSLMVRMIPQPLAAPVAEPARSDPVAYGRYLAILARCESCHTPNDQDMNPIPERRYAGGHEFASPGGVVASSNITAHVDGVGGMTRAEFIGLFRRYADTESAAVPVPAAQNTPMPWLSFAGMTDDDLGAIYTFLMTVPPVAGKVATRPPAAAAASTAPVTPTPASGTTGSAAGETP